MSQAPTRTPEGTMVQSAGKTLTILVALTACASPIAEAASPAEESHEKTPRLSHVHLLRPGSCYDMAYETRGITIPIVESRSVQKRVTAYICWHEFKLVPHNWP
jgi:hypothetical protein